MYAAAYLSGRKESRKNIEVGIDHFSFGIDSESAHAVVNARPETAGKESTFIDFGIVEDLRLEIGIGLLRDGVIPTLNAF